MECTSCAPTAGVAQRADRPHTFLHHEPSRCERCGQDVEARVVLRQGAVVRPEVLRAAAARRRRSSPTTRTRTSRPSSKRGEVTDDSRDHLFKHTTSTCPECLALLAGRGRDSPGQGVLQEGLPRVRALGGAGDRGRALLRARLRLRPRRHRAAEVRRRGEARLPHRLRHLRRPRAAHLPAHRRGHRPLQPRVPHLHRQQPVLEPHRARRRSSGSSTDGGARGPAGVPGALGRRAHQPPADPRAGARSRTARRSAAWWSSPTACASAGTARSPRRIKASGAYVGPAARRLHRRHPREDPRQGSHARRRRRR